jgi:SulP family sulfate permease
MDTNRREKQGEGVEPYPATAILKLDLLRRYRLAWLPRDLLAGLVIFAVTVPAALAYGQLAGLRPVNGLYASLLAMGIYAFFGTSRQLIIDAEAAVAILVASSLTALAADGDPARFAALAMMEAIIVGGLQVAAGVCRLGFVSDFIPKSVVIGFLNGMALIIIMAQAGKIFGIKLVQTDFFPRVWEFYTQIHAPHHLTMIVGVGCLLGLFVLRFLPMIPEAILVIVLATAAAVWWHLGEQGISLVGLVPAGLPRPELPRISLSDILNLFPIALGVALVSYVDTTITGRAFAAKGRYRLDPDQELIALGLANAGCGLCQGFTVGSSHSRTAINDMYGGRSQLAGLIAAGLLALFLLRFTYVLQNVPQVTLAAIIVMAGIRLFSVKEVMHAWRTRPASAYYSLATTAAVLIAGLMIGVLVAVVFAIILVLHRLARPHEIITRPPVSPGLLIYRFGGPLFFFNAPHFANRVRELIDSARPQVTFFLINAEAIVDMDINAVEMLEELFNELRSRGIVLGICEAKGHFRKVLTNTRLHGRDGFNLYCTLAEVMRKLRQERELNQAQPKAEVINLSEEVPSS